MKKLLILSCAFAGGIAAFGLEFKVEKNIRYSDAAPRCVLQAEADAQPSASDIASLARAMRQGQGSCVLVTEPQFPARIVEMLVRETGARVLELDPLASGPSSPEPGWYEKAMARNIETLHALLKP